MRRLGTWLIAVSLTVLAAVTAAILLQPSQTVGNVTSIEQALTAEPSAWQAEPGAQGSSDQIERPGTGLESQPSEPGAADQSEIVSQAARASAPAFPVQDSSLDALELTGPRPIWIRIDSIGVAHEVSGYGVNPRSGQMDVPNNVSDVAWYEYGPSPGEPGSAVLAAHVDLTGSGPGVFYHLGDLEEGAIVVVGFDNGATQRFQVEARTTYLKDDLPLDAIFSRTGPSVLTLITCGGGFNQSVRSYDSNVVAYAVPIEDPDIAS